MKTYNDLSKEDKDKFMSYSITKSHVNATLNSNFMVAFMFLLFVVVFTSSITLVGLNLLQINIDTAISVINISFVSSMIGMFLFFIMLVYVIVYKKEMYEKTLYAMYEIEPNDIFDIKEKDLKKIVRSWKKKGD